MTDDKVKEMIARIQEAGDAMTSDQLRTVIAKIQDGRDRRGREQPLISVSITWYRTRCG